MNYPSKLVEDAVNEISRLPGIGKKSALRLALHLLKSDKMVTHNLTMAINDLVEKTTFCSVCHNISDSEICRICDSIKRDDSILAIVQDTKDVLAIENTSQYQGKYHVLGGVISPIQGIGPSDLNIDSLVERIKNNPAIKEIIIALSPTMEGDTTAFYIKKKLKEFTLKISTIARGIPIGGDLEYTDEITLGRSILSRIEF
ncbi:MAG: recombination protein RecR [Cytophagaceae bacterium]|nr:recombination protein RecR [Cytophagaceae bacterium]MBK9511539.1 recombination protein RecR [Cytophagaceae bacterium]MBK9932918.1 recombination protein RecR [Cytophagaceae bacterium]MBL0303373.1 recombination protein RecR [Cytophagaceae bacterium]MBL0326221.1 recombination protein RecR [Cytophagaceae bacterium]